MKMYFRWKEHFVSHLEITKCTTMLYSYNNNIYNFLPKLWYCFVWHSSLCFESDIVHILTCTIYAFLKSHPENYLSDSTFQFVGCPWSSLINFSFQHPTERSNKVQDQRNELTMEYHLKVRSDALQTFHVPCSSICLLWHHPIGIPTQANCHIHSITAAGSYVTSQDRCYNDYMAIVFRKSEPITPKTSNSVP